MNQSRQETMNSTFTMLYGKPREEVFQEVFANYVSYFSTFEDMLDNNAEPYTFDIECTHDGDTAKIVHYVDGIHNIKAVPDGTHKVTLMIRVKEEAKFHFSYGLFLVLKHLRIPIIMHAQNKVRVDSEPKVCFDEAQQLQSLEN